MNIIGVIPARMQSTRFPGKPLAKIAGVEMIRRTYEQAAQSQYLDKVIVATDSEVIAEFCVMNRLSVMMTSANCATGTDRVAEVAHSIRADLYVNIQGDEPVIDPAAIDAVVKAYAKHGDAYCAYNLYQPIASAEEASSPAVIKVTVNERGELVYMSRNMIPYSKAGAVDGMMRQVCVYGFTPAALGAFYMAGNKTCNEQHEDIETLRLIDLGMKVKMIETDCVSIPVDYPEDVLKVEQYLKGK